MRATGCILSSLCPFIHSLNCSLDDELFAQSNSSINSSLKSWIELGWIYNTSVGLCTRAKGFKSQEISQVQSVIDGLFFLCLPSQLTMWFEGGWRCPMPGMFRDETRLLLPKMCKVYAGRVTWPAAQEGMKRSCFQFTLQNSNSKLQFLTLHRRLPEGSVWLSGWAWEGHWSSALPASFDISSAQPCSTFLFFS